MPGSKGGDDDRTALKEAFAGVRPLRGDAKKRVARADRTRSADSPRRPGDVRLQLARDPDGTVTAQRAGTHPSIVERLEDPYIDIDAECDLHGMTVAEANRAVLAFVKRVQQRGGRWVLIIVGKGLHSPGGRGTLADHVAASLSGGAAARYVLAFRTAPRRLGGAGALTVRLVDRL